MSTAIELLTAEQYLQRPDCGRPTELVRGRIASMNPPGPRHGQICAAVYRIVGNHAHQHQLGHVLMNDSGVITERNPDTVRGADVAFYCHENVPPGPLPNEYLPVPPDLVFEVMSPGDRRSQVLAKVAEYLNAGVTVVCVLEDQTQTLQTFYSDRPFETLAADQSFTLPDILGDLRVPVRRFFES